MARLLGRIFADGSRIWVIPALAALFLLDVGLWTAFKSTAAPPYITCLEAAAGPQPCVGEELVFPLQIVREVRSERRFRVGRIDGDIDVMGPSHGLAVGDEVTVGGLRTEAGLEAAFVQTHPGRPWKRRLGLVGIVVIGVLLVAGFGLRRTDAGWRVVPRWSR